MLGIRASLTRDRHIDVKCALCRSWPYLSKASFHLFNVVFQRIKSHTVTAIGVLSFTNVFSVFLLALIVLRA